VAVVIPLNNFLGPADDTVTAQTYYRIQNTALSKAELRQSELTSVGTTSQQTVRDVRREQKNEAYTEFRLDPATWCYHDRFSIESKKRWSEHRCEKKLEDGSTRFFFKGDWESLELSPNTGVAQKLKYFGEGAERLVAKFREVDQRGFFVGDQMV